MGQMLAARLPTVATLNGMPLPLVGRARVYACGITPYDVTHLGHAATFIWVDTLARVLHAAGTEVIVCRNVTDVDDVLLGAASRAGAPFGEFAAIQQFYFDQDMAALGVRPPTLQPRAHAYIGQVIALAAGLLARDAAYQRDWLRLLPCREAVAERSGLDRAEALRLAGEFGDRPDDARKDDPFDVAVWQASTGGPAGLAEPVGPGPAGLARRVRGDGAVLVRLRRGRPGWGRRPALPAPRLSGRDGRDADRGDPVRPGPAQRRRGPGGRGQDGQVGGQPGTGQLECWPSTRPAASGC